MIFDITYKGMIKIMEKKLRLNPERCKGCGLCVSNCPKKVLGLEKTRLNKKVYRPITILNITNCIKCGICTLICPDLAILLESDKED